MTHFIALRRIGAFVATGLLVLGLAVANAATITIVNNNAAGVGFNDPTPVAPVGGNPGTTLGAQRLYIFQYAANIWGSILPSAVPIQVNSTFSALTCTATSATLGSTGANTVHQNFAGAPFTNTWYVQSLANRLAGVDLSANADMTAQFNLTLDAGSASCLGGQKWYYGVDGLEGSNVELLPVVLHELGHGLGFMTTTSGSTGNYQSSTPSIYDRFLYDESTGLHWNQETATQRKASAISVTGLAWDGAGVHYGAASFLGPRPRLKINAPGSLAGDYSVGLASFGPQSYNVSGDVVLVVDAVAPTSDGCDAITNAAQLAGKIALIDRGTCTFVIKAAAAQAAGAIGILIANNAAGIQPPGGADPTITIPVVGISQADGNSIKTALGLGTVNVTMGFDPTFKAGADNAGRPLMYAPATFTSGSSVSHYDVTLSPNALMEPAINNDLHDNVDITRNLMSDIGWIDFTVATTLQRFTAADRADGIQLSWAFSDPASVGAVTVERAGSDQGPWSAVGLMAHTVDGGVEAVDNEVRANETYFYRLSVMDRAGAVSHFGLVSARHASPITGAAALMAPSPNPASHGSTLSFRISQPEFVRLSIVDATGRTVRTLQNGMMAPGAHTALWDGMSDAGTAAPAGLYFVAMRTSAGLQSQRLAVVR